MFKIFKKISLPALAAALFLSSTAQSMDHPSFQHPAPGTKLVLQVVIHHSYPILSRKDLFSLLSIDTENRNLLTSGYVKSSSYNQYLYVKLDGSEGDSDEDLFVRLGQAKFVFHPQFFANINPNLTNLLKLYACNIDITDLKNCKQFDFSLPNNEMRDIFFYGDRISQKHSSLKDFRKSLEDKCISPEKNSKESLQLARMQFKGLGGGRNYELARVNLEQLLQNDAHLEAQTKAEATFLLARMQFKGLGGNRNYELARVNLEQLLQNDAHLEAQTKAEATFLLASMQFYGEGGDCNYELARVNLEQLQQLLQDDARLEAQTKAEATFLLAWMQYYGEGGGRNYKSARKYFEQLLRDNEILEPEDEAEATFLLASMQCHGEGGERNYELARVNLEHLQQLLQDGVRLEAQTKTEATFLLAWVRSMISEEDATMN